MSTRQELIDELVALGYARALASRLSIPTMLDIVEDRFFNLMTA